MIKFLDLHKINKRFQEEFKASFDFSLEASNYILGKNVSDFETNFAKYCGTNYCLGMANGLDALTLILKGYIQIGKLKKGDHVIVPANTFVATILSVLHAGLEPVFIEPNPKTYTISAAKVKAKLTDKIKAVVMVHLYGQLADVESLKKISKSNNLLLIEDAAQAHGATSKNDGLKAGNVSDAAAFSFYPSKNLGALGDGGAITTNNKDLYQVLKLLRNYGSAEKYKNEIIGFNSRLDDIQAAFLNIKLKRLDADNERRRTVAKRYLNGIKNHRIKLPLYDGSKNHVFYAFVVEVEHRIEFIQYLDHHKIGWLIHYPIPPHKQDAFHRFSDLKLPITEEIHKRIISLPISPVISDNDINTVIEILNRY